MYSNVNEVSRAQTKPFNIYKVKGIVLLTKALKRYLNLSTY